MAAGRGQRGGCHERETAPHSLRSLLTGAYRCGEEEEGEGEGKGREEGGRGEESWERSQSSPT